MSVSPLLLAAARNNAEWCDAFCRSRGVAGRFGRDSWTSPTRTPPLYPDAVTLRPGAVAEELLSAIDTSEGCSVKDSFDDLRLTGLGFRPLLRGEWLLLEVDETPAAGVREWSALTQPEQLAEWETAWAEAPEAPGFFRPALLADETIRILARRDAGRIVAGAIARRSAAVIGLSNVFDTTGDLESAYRGGATAARALWPQLPVVGYDSGASLAAAQRAGFASVGRLVVWVNAPS